jgi:hypothetical protein
MAPVRESMPSGESSPKKVGIEGGRADLLWKFLPREIMNQPEKLSVTIKVLRVPLLPPPPLAEAISKCGQNPFVGLGRVVSLAE